MPGSTRKSSIGTRRGIQKYIPYRADDFEHGKKTGIAVAYVDHKSDEFEPFDKVIGQADQRTPPRVQNVRKKRTPKPKTPVMQEEEDEDGEMSMELEESIPNSPSAYFAHARVNAITSSVVRVGSYSRPVAHTSDVDFDKVPSPRDSPIFSARRTAIHARSPGPSHLSQTALGPIDEDAPMDDGDMDYGGGPDFDAAGFDSDDDNDLPVAPYPDEPQEPMKTNGGPTPRTSFAQMDQEEEDEKQQYEDDEHMPMDVDSPTIRTQDEQLANGHVSHEDMDMEDDIAHGLEEVEQGPDEEDVEEEQPKKRDGEERGDDDSIEKHQPANKKARKETENEGAKKPRGRPRKKDNVLRELTYEDHNANANGVRRSSRLRITPLEWWRGEKVIYGSDDSGEPKFVATIKAIRRLPKEQPKPLGTKHRVKKRSARSKSKTVEVEVSENLVFNPEEGWDDSTKAEGVVIDYETETEVEKKVAFTAKMIAPKAAANNDFYFQKIFGEGDFIAAGLLIIPPDKQKPTKGTKDNTFVFYVIEGAVNFKVHRTSYLIATGGMFLVPRGNMYFIQNVSDRDARLFFAQARKVVDEEARERSLSHKSEGLRQQLRSSSERELSEVPIRRATSSRA
ncbi:uncharacterized protein LAESUDRAFT_722528 [Laetiporus sulphureus 93-53]|uniref:CENP-C homolog n=1 Tax=Laetiporus sulphureus 93-53 TaxID=1314785 RepID=A0A165FXZ9_9APHY|nr:uncharacterized protein LAESUDRAFT_722528 [Laetiporus sulphureus 93-53]KZT09565.1 hypothetical protein LAESUDRAFT_722528 [Laetiporus sulphureus 93-53]